MPSYDETPATGGGSGPLTLLEGHLLDLRARIERARADVGLDQRAAEQAGAAPGEQDADVRARLFADLETAYEELRVAEEEVRTQQDEIARLLEGRNLLQWQQERILAALPVPTLTTDEHGIIRTANAAAAGLVEMRVSRLLGKPVLTVFPYEDRADLRRLISTQARDGRPFQWRSTIERRGGAGPGIEVDVSATPLPEHGQGTTWMLLESGSAGAEPPPQALPAALSRLAALPSSTESLQQLINLAVEVCHSALGDVELTISVGPPEEPDALASTSRVAQELDGAQIVHSQGPCVAAYATQGIVVSPDLVTDPRWPALHRDVPDSVGAVLAVPLQTGDRLVGALNVYGHAGTPIEELTQPAELLGATLAAVLYEFGLKNELRDMATDMERALTSRAVIDQAKGIVMADRGCTADEAFRFLVELSSTQQVKLREVARALVERRGGSGR